MSLARTRALKGSSCGQDEGKHDIAVKREIRVSSASERATCLVVQFNKRRKRARLWKRKLACLATICGLDGEHGYSMLLL